MDAIFHKNINYSETLPYGHLSNTVTSLLWPLFFGCMAKTAIHFLVKKTLVNTAKFFWTTSDHINPLSPNGDQHQFSPNDIHTLSKEMVMRVNKMITTEKTL